jgi:hypothetical protein
MSYHIEINEYQRRLGAFPHAQHMTHRDATAWLGM